MKPLRIVALLAFAAAGIGLAFALAWKTDPPTDPVHGVTAHKVSAPLANPVHSLPRARATEIARKDEPAVDVAPAPTAEIPTMMVAYEGLVARQMRKLEESISEVREQGARQERSLAQTLTQIEQKVEDAGALPPAPAPELPEEALPPPNPGEITRGTSDGKLTVILQNTDIRTALKLLSEQGGINILASKSVTGEVTASLTDVDVETALAALLQTAGFISRKERGIVYVGTPADFDSMDQVRDKISMRVYRPNYIKAADLETLIRPMLTPTTGVVTVSAPAQIDIPSDQTKTGANDFAGTDVVVVKDYEAVLFAVDDLFQEVDIKPTQVSIEAMIINVKLNDQNLMGINFQALRDQAHARVVAGTTPLTSLATLDASGGGLKFGVLDSSLSGFLTALETVGDTNVIASPRVLCLNKQRAEIQIGEQLGYVNTTVTQTFSTQSVSFLDVGTLLRIRPFIGNDGFIRMEVHPELSTGSVTVSNGLTLPNKSVTQVTGNVGCYDGKTVVIGGLLREDLNTTTNQVPYLGNLPWVGPIFRNKSEKIIRDEIVVLITPRIVVDEHLGEEGNKLRGDFTQKQEVYFDKMSPIAKRNNALRYQRLALAAYNAGDYDQAIKQIDWSIQFDPMNRQAIALRNDIVAAGGFEGETVRQYLNHARAPWHRPHYDYSKQGAPWKPDHSQEQNIILSDDPGTGTPGSMRTIPTRPPSNSSRP